MTQLVNVPVPTISNLVNNAMSYVVPWIIVFNPENGDFYIDGNFKCDVVDAKAKYANGTAVILVTRNGEYYVIDIDAASEYDLDFMIDYKQTTVFFAYTENTTNESFHEYLIGSGYHPVSEIKCSDSMKLKYITNKTGRKK